MTDDRTSGNVARPIRYYGSLRFHAGKWIMEVEPHVAIRLKRVFERIEKQGGRSLRVKDNAEIRHELLWFMERYPLETTKADMERLRRGRDDFLDMQQRCDAIIANVVPPKTGVALAIPLRDYQERGVALIHTRRRVLIGDDVGLGKTPLALGALAPGDMRPALVVTQTHLALQWERQAKKFLPGLSTYVFPGRSPAAMPDDRDIYVTTYSRIIGLLGDKTADAKKLLSGFFKSVVFDEIQELRSPSAAKYDAARQLSDAATAVIGLSATPIYNYGDEAFWVFDLIETGALGTRDEFIRDWCVQRGARQVVREPEALGAYLREIHLLLRRTRPELARELPPVERIIIDVPYDEAAITRAMAETADLAERVLMGSFIERGQAARELDARLRLVTGVAKSHGVAQFVRGLLESEKKVLLVGWHRAVYSVWMRELAEFNPVLYTGSEDSAAKEKSRVAFMEGDSRVMIMSLRSGVGLDGLQEVCQVVVFGELDWSPGVTKQVIGRLARDGVAKGVAAFFLVADGGSDPLMVDVLGLKAVQAAGIINLGERPEAAANYGTNEDGQENDAAAKGEDDASVPGGDELKGIDTDRLKRLATEILKRSGKDASDPPDSAPRAQTTDPARVETQGGIEEVPQAQPSVPPKGAKGKPQQAVASPITSATSSAPSTNDAGSHRSTLPPGSRVRVRPLEGDDDLSGNEG